MAKALMVASPLVAFASGDECNLYGTTSISATEANSQTSATEACTFSLLGMNIISGGSGTNNLQFRVGGANGNELATRAGTGSAEDAVNTDALSAAALFNLAYTDTGSDSTCSWLKGVVDFASGYGCFQGSGAFAGPVYDVPSATQFIGLSGGLPADGVATEANVAFLARGYDTFAALQVRVTANARTNNSVFKNRINGADGTGTITYAAGATGLVSATGLTDAITAGQTIGASITLLTGVEDLSVSLVVATLKSSITKQDVWAAQTAGVARAASSTESYLPIGGRIQALTSYTEAQARIKPGFAGTASNLRCYLSANTYSVAGTLKLMQNGSAVITTPITLLGGAGWYENTTDTVTFTATDEFSLEFDEGTTGSITIQMAGLTLAPSSAAVPVFYHHYQQQRMS